MDKLSTLIGRQTFNARVFFNGKFCDANEFPADAVAGHLHVLRDGPVVFTHEGALPVQLDAPSMVFYPRGMRHRLEVPPGATATLLCALIHFPDGHANPLVRVLPDIVQMRLDERTPMRHTLDLLFAEAQAGMDVQGRDVILDRLCDVLMIQVIRHQFDHGCLSTGMLAGLADRHLAPVLDAMHARPHEPWQLASLAALACMSRARFTEHFRSVIGMPPIDYLTRWRVGVACSLLRKGAPVKVVSAQAGYASSAAFTRAFTAQIGLSPREWLRAQSGDAT
jgi:AraC-like DNA-binding protein